MKTRVICCLIIMSVSSLISAFGQAISPSEAAKHVGETETVCGTIASEHAARNSRGTPTFINLDKPYPEQIFTALVWGDDRPNVGQLPKNGRVCVAGRITDYRGSPEIVVRDAKRWYVPK